MPARTFAIKQGKPSGLYIKEMLVAGAVLIVLACVSLIVIHELLNDRVPYERTSELAGNDTDVAHGAG